MMLDGLLSRARNRRGRLRGYSGCLRCGDTWDWKTYHVTRYQPAGMVGVARGCFPLCEQCWQALTPHERLPFYAELVQQWTTARPPFPLSETLDEWPAIRDAVLDGG